MKQTTNQTNVQASPLTSTEAAANIDQIFTDNPEPTTETKPASALPQPEINPEVTQVQPVEVSPDGRPKPEIASNQPAIPKPVAESAPTDPLANPLEPVIEQETEQIRNPASVAALHKDVQKMIKEGQFAGVEAEVIGEREENTRKISLS